MHDKNVSAFSTRRAKKKSWGKERSGGESNPRSADLQSAALPLGHRSRSHCKLWDTSTLVECVTAGAQVSAGPMGCGSSVPARPAADDEPAKPRVAFDPAVAAAGTWLDPSGATPYDKLLIQLLSVDGVTNRPVVAMLTGGGCGQAGTIRFNATRRGEAEGRSVWGVGGAGVMCMLAHRRDCSCAEVQRHPHRIGHLLRKCLRCNHNRPSDALVPARSSSSRSHPRQPICSTT